jgi:hypothetical protein
MVGRTVPMVDILAVLDIPDPDADADDAVAPEDDSLAAGAPPSAGRFRAGEGSAGCCKRTGSGDGAFPLPLFKTGEDEPARVPAVPPENTPAVGATAGFRRGEGTPIGWCERTSGAVMPLPLFKTGVFKPSLFASLGFAFPRVGLTARSFLKKLTASGSDTPGKLVGAGGDEGVVGGDGGASVGGEAAAGGGGGIGGAGGWRLEALEAVEACTYTCGCTG